ncbi:MAG: DUF4334 domain-containing protein [Kutzneria sp.]|nr:DUF4334 domain-containing protein [Kutzneria sp.]
MTSASVVARIDELRVAEIADPAELDALWAQLTPVRAEALLGRWKGGDFATGHPLRALLVLSGWCGKHFDALDDAKPLMCQAADGSLFSNVDLANGGEASLWNVEFRGEVTAALVYDTVPVVDHFKRVDEETLLGVTSGKGTLPIVHNGHPYYFWLERQP